MNLRLILSFLVLISLSFTACKKKDSPVPVIRPVTAKTDSIVPSKATPASAYPYTQNYVGLLTNNMDNDMPGGLKDTDKVFVFYVSHPAADSLVFTSWQGVILSYNNAVGYVNHVPVLVGVDIITARVKTNDSCSFVDYLQNGYPGGPFYTFRITKDSLYASWQYQRAILGTCDYGFCTGQFAGKLKQ